MQYMLKTFARRFMRSGVKMGVDSMSSNQGSGENNRQNAQDSKRTGQIMRVMRRVFRF